MTLEACTRCRNAVDRCFCMGGPRIAVRTGPWEDDGSSRSRPWRTLDDLENPRWDDAQKCHDWRNHVPPFVRSVWPAFNHAQRERLAEWAQVLAEAEP